MTDKTQPLALMLAEQYDYGDPVAHSNTWKAAVCTELRSQHARIAELEARVQELGAMARENRSRRIVELEAQLDSIRAGGVQALSAAPAGFVPVSAFDRLHAHAESLAARLLAAEQAAPKAAPATVSRTQHSQFLSDVLTAAGLITHGKQCKALGERLADMVMRLREAPQQEAQEPAFWMNEKGHTWSHSDWKQFPKHRAKYPIPLYPHFPAPQPAPAPLSDDVVKDAARYRWLIDQHWIQTEVDWRLISTDQDSTIKQLDAAIDAALAKQGGTP